MAIIGDWDVLSPNSETIHTDRAWTNKMTFCSLFLSTTFLGDLKACVWILYLKVISRIFIHRIYSTKNLRCLVEILKNAKLSFLE